MPQPLLAINGLKTEFRTNDGIVKAVDGVSFTIDPGDTVGVVGESGSGKSVTHLSFLGLIQPPGKVTAGTALYKGKDLLQLHKNELRKIRGNEISVIFQDPMTSLNPYLRISRQMTEGLEIHKNLPRREALSRAIEMLRLVGIADPENRIRDFPHQFSGGMRQRVMIAMSLTCSPSLLIADEPTTALDVTIQAQILELLQKIQHETGTAIMLITHDLGVVAGVCDKIIVMYAGKVVETAPTAELFARPLHPYTLSLLKSIPRLDAESRERLFSIPGLPPDPIRMPPGCSFSPRCPFASDRCSLDSPALHSLSPTRSIACWYDVENKKYSFS